MKVVILAGGKGTRYSHDKPKALSTVGDRPILCHLMKLFSLQGFKDFIICLGWKQKEIIDFFECISKKRNLNIKENYNITFVDTGEESNIAQRIKLIESYIPKEDKNFFCVYCDGIANLNLNKLYVRHITNKNIATLTIVRPYSQFGIIKTNDDKITYIEEKPRMQEYINSGFFLFSTKIFNYIEENDKSDIDIFKRLIEIDELGYYKHEGFWETINSPKDEIRLNEIYNKSIENKTELEWYNII